MRARPFHFTFSQLLLFRRRGKNVGKGQGKKPLLSHLLEQLSLVSSRSSLTHLLAQTRVCLLT